MRRRLNLAALALVSAAALVACADSKDGSGATSDTCEPPPPGVSREGGAPEGGAPGGPASLRDGGDEDFADGGRPPLANAPGAGVGGQGCPAQ